MDIAFGQPLQRVLRQCPVAPRLAEALGAAYERWDGRGWRGELKGDQVPVAARLAQMAEFIEVAHRMGGIAAAKELAYARRGKQFDPTLADLLDARADVILEGLDTA